MTEKTLFVIVFFIISITSYSQENIPLRTILTSTTIGVGNADILDTYLTPLDYKGWNINLRHERIQIAKRSNNNRINQQNIWAYYSSNDNIANNGMVVSGFLGYSWGTLWFVEPIEKLILFYALFALV